jgi:hypothetical protein
MESYSESVYINDANQLVDAIDHQPILFEGQQILCDEEKQPYVVGVGYLQADLSARRPAVRLVSSSHLRYRAYTDTVYLNEKHQFVYEDGSFYHLDDDDTSIWLLYPDEPDTIVGTIIELTANGKHFSYRRLPVSRDDAEVAALEQSAYPFFYENPAMMRKAALIVKLFDTMNEGQRQLFNRMVRLITVDGACELDGVRSPQLIILDAPPGTGKSTLIKFITASLHTRYKSCVVAHSNKVVMELTKGLPIPEFANFRVFDVVTTVCKFIWPSRGHLRSHIDDFDAFTAIFSDFSRHVRFRNSKNGPHRDLEEQLFAVYQVLETLLPKRRENWHDDMNTTKLLYVDEYTVLSPWLIVVLIVYSRFCGINLIFLGDHCQMGNIERTIYHPTGTNYDLIRRFTPHVGRNFSLTYGMRFRGDEAYGDFLQKMREDFVHNNYGGGIIEQRATQVNLLYTDRLFLFEEFPELFFPMATYNSRASFFAFRHVDLADYQEKCYTDGLSKQTITEHLAKKRANSGRIVEYTRYEDYQVWWSKWVTDKIKYRQDPRVRETIVNDSLFYSSATINVYMSALDVTRVEEGSLRVQNGSAQYIPEILLQVGGIYLWVKRNRLVTIRRLNVHKCEITKRPFLYSIDIESVDNEFEPVSIQREPIHDRFKNVPIVDTMWQHLREQLLTDTPYQFPLMRREYTFSASQGLTVYGEVALSLNTTNKNAIYVGLSRVSKRESLVAIYSKHKWSLLYTWYRNCEYLFKFSINRENSVPPAFRRHMLAELNHFAVKGTRRDLPFEDPFVGTFTVCDNIQDFETAELPYKGYTEMAHFTNNYAIRRELYIKNSVENADGAALTDVEAICQFLLSHGSEMVVACRRKVKYSMKQLLIDDKNDGLSQLLIARYHKWKRDNNIITHAPTDILDRGTYKNVSFPFHSIN